MRLSDFILENLEAILQQWEDFARTIDRPGQPLDAAGLRDHAQLMLETIAADVSTHQSIRQQLEKSHGHGPGEDDSAAETHAITRLIAGFTIDQIVAEFRALRASVISLWMEHVQTGEHLEVQDMIRFNEAIDQALAESIASYTAAVQASRNIFLGILGHDLRTPLGAILLGADVLLRTDDLGARSTKIASRIYSSVKRASQIVGDLLDFTRSQQGPGIPVSRMLIDVVPVCERIVDESRTVHPEARIQLNSAANVVGHFDGARLEQVFSNLIGNAIQHGDGRSLITVELALTDPHLTFSVHNHGSLIPADVLPLIFNPLGRFSRDDATQQGAQSSLGLGLYIAAEIVTAHEGRIDVTSTVEGGTTFTVVLPLTPSSGACLP
jgi:signal transduction histidine kinase